MSPNDCYLSPRSKHARRAYPHILGGHHVCISADGHRQTYSPANFAAKFNWKNDPSKARLLQADK